MSFLCIEIILLKKCHRKIPNPQIQPPPTRALHIPITIIPEYSTPQGVRYQTWDTVLSTNFDVFYLVMKHSVECLIWLPKKLIFVKEIKDAKTRNFSSDFQTRVSAWFPFYFLYELLMSLRIQIKRFCSIKYWGSSSFPFADCNRHYQKRLNDQYICS